VLCVEQIHTHLLTCQSNRLQTGHYCLCKSPLHDLADRDVTFHSMAIELVILAKENINTCSFKPAFPLVCNPVHYFP